MEKMEKSVTSKWMLVNFILVTQLSPMSGGRNNKIL